MTTMPNTDRNPAWLPRGGPEPAGSYNGRPFRRYKVVLAPGELAQCVVRWGGMPDA
jgi:hypothetical protein